MRGIFLIAITLFCGTAAAQSGVSHFPEPLRAGESASPGAPPADEKRGRAMQAYSSGREVAEREHDFQGALGFFRQALVFERSSTVLYSIAACKKAMNRPVEALFMFANALFVDSRMPPEERLSEEFAKRARSSINRYLAGFASVRVRAPGGSALREVTLNGIPVMSTALFGQLGNPILLAGGVPPWVARASFSYPSDFVFFVIPGVYDVEFTFTDGKRIFIDSRRIKGKGHEIDLGSERLPARLVIENILPGTRVRFKTDTQVLLDREFDIRRKKVSLGGLGQGSYDLEVSRRGFDDYAASLQLSRGEKSRVVLDLQPKRAVKSWKLWLPVGIVVAAGIITAVVIAVAANSDDPPAQNGEGVVTVGVF